MGWIVCAVAAAVFTLAMVQHSMKHGRLLLPPSYDDVTYFLDGLERLDRLHNDGLRGLIALHTADPPHSPFSTYLAMGAFAVAGPREWAPYAANGLLILFLLLALRKLWPEASARVRIGLAAFVLSVPIAGELVVEFRPDVACGLLSALGVVLAIQSPLARSSARQAIVAGLCFAAALLIKPSIFPLTLALLGVTLVLSLLLGRKADAARPSPAAQASHPWRHAIYLLLAACLPALPQAVLRGQRYWEYIRDSQFADAKPIADLAGGPLTQVRYYLDGYGGQVMLGGHLLPLGLLLAGATVGLALRRDRSALARIGALLVALAVSLAVPVLNPVKQQFFGVTMQWLLIFSALLALSWLVRSPEAVTPAREPRWLAWLLGGLLLWGGLEFRWPPRWDATGTESAATTRRVVNEVYAELRAMRGRPGTTVFLTSIGSVNADVLRWLARVDRLDGFTFHNAPFTHDLGVFKDSIRRADIVIAGEPGQTEAAPGLVSTELQAQTLELVRADGAFLPPLRVPTGNDKALLIFERLQPFAGLRGVSGLWELEGPYPQWGLPLVRWGVGPATRFDLSTATPARRRIVLDCKSDLADQQMLITLDGREVLRHDFEAPSRFDALEFTLELSPGPHELTFHYTRWEKGVRQAAVLFRTLQILPVEG